MDDLVERLRGLADCDARAGEPLGRCMREAADKIDGLEADLEAAVAVAWERGATEWARVNYPRQALILERAR